MNWDRPRGCLCQHKSVDWCGCSPIVFRASSYRSIKREGKKITPSFFARKFDAMISNNIIAVVDQTFLKFNMTGYNNEHDYYFENVFTASEYNIVSKSYLTYFSSFVRLATKLCLGSDPSPQHPTLLEVSLVFKDDSFMGYIVLFSLQAESGLVLLQEALLQPIYREKKNPPVTSSALKVSSFTVGTNFDAKEHLFRNFGSLLTVVDTVSVAITWPSVPNKQEQFRLVVSPPPGSYPSTVFDVEVKSGRAVTHNIIRDGTLSAGVWIAELSVKSSNETISIMFPVVPIHVVSFKRVCPGYDGEGGGI